LENLKTTPKRYQDPLLWVWLEIIFCPKRYQFLHNTLSPATTAKSLAVDLSRLNSLRGTKTAFLTTKRYNKHPPRHPGTMPPTLCVIEIGIYI